MCRIKKIKKIFLLLVIIITEVGLVCGQTDSVKEGYKLPPAAENSFSFFDRNDLLEISLSYDIGYYMKEKPDDSYMEALMTVYFSPVDSLNKTVRLRARGNYRYRTCLFPPIRLNFKKSDFGYSDIDEFDNVKVVTHCDTSEIFEKYMLREYLVYKMLNIVSDYSFRVRLLKINYNDISGSMAGFTKYAFAIEPIKELLKRTGGAELEDIQIGFDDIIEGQIEPISLFQYMIGNSDWFLSMNHNLKFADTNGAVEGGVAAIPYDFDYCGFVNTAYAEPRKDLGLEKITDRAYLGPCIEENKLREVLGDFLQYKEQFIVTIRNFEYLDRSERRELERYIEGFFDEYKRDLIIEKINKTCIKN